MQAADIISEVDALEPNQYGMEFKLRWLSDLDGQIFDEVMKQHLPLTGNERLRPFFWGNPLDQDGIGPTERCAPCRCHKRREEPEEEEEEEESSGGEEECPCGPEPEKRRPRRYPDRNETWRWPYLTGGEEMLIREPYARDVYEPYLEAMIARANHEYIKYNAQMTLYNAAYAKWTAYINRTFIPRQPKSGNRWRF